jgi:hypothetical protein
MRPLLVLSLTAFLASAQQVTPPSRSVNLRLLSFDPEGSNPDLHCHDVGNAQKPPGVKTPLKNYLNHELSALKLSGRDLVFSNSPQAPSAENSLGRVTLPEKGDRFLLLFFPAEKPGNYRIMAMDESLQAFPLGSFRVFNVSSSKIRLTLEKTDYECLPGKETMITNPPVGENHHSGMYAHAWINDNWQRIGSGLWPHPGVKRDLEIFFDNPETEQIELRGFRDISPPQK